MFLNIQLDKTMPKTPKGIWQEFEKIRQWLVECGYTVDEIAESAFDFEKATRSDAYTIAPFFGDGWKFIQRYTLGKDNGSINFGMVVQPHHCDGHFNGAPLVPGIFHTELAGHGAIVLGLLRGVLPKGVTPRLQGQISEVTAQFKPGEKIASIVVPIKITGPGIKRVYVYHMAITFRVNNCEILAVTVFYATMLDGSGAIVKPKR
jgi:hypothetical protein